MYRASLIGVVSHVGDAIYRIVCHLGGSISRFVRHRSGAIGHRLNLCCHSHFLQLV